MPSVRSYPWQLGRIFEFERNNSPTRISRNLSIDFIRALLSCDPTYVKWLFPARAVFSIQTTNTKVHITTVVCCLETSEIMLL